MPRSLAVTLSCVVFSWVVLLNGSPASAADRAEHFEYWAGFVGVWQMENESLDLTITRTDSGACFIFETPSITFVHGWDPAEDKMKTLSFYEDGAHGTGHATIENGDMVGRSATSNPDGTSRDATWRMTKPSDAQLVFTTGTYRFVFNRRN